MSKAKFLFSTSREHFSVQVENLEELSVEEIQKIESFVSARNGIFDFKTYSFIIKKRVTFIEFLTLLKYSDIEHISEEIARKATTTLARIEFGKYKGMFYSEAPDSYLLWLKGNYRGKDRDIIDAELKSRAL